MTDFEKAHAKGVRLIKASQTSLRSMSRTQCRMCHVHKRENIIHFAECQTPRLSGSRLIFFF